MPNLVREEPVNPVKCNAVGKYSARPVMNKPFKPLDTVLFAENLGK